MTANVIDSLARICVVGKSERRDSHFFLCNRGHFDRVLSILTYDNFEANKRPCGTRHAVKLLLWTIEPMR